MASDNNSRVDVDKNEALPVSVESAEEQLQATAIGKKKRSKRKASAKKKAARRKARPRKKAQSSEPAVLDGTSEEMTESLAEVPAKDSTDSSVKQSGSDNVTQKEDSEKEELENAAVTETVSSGDSEENSDGSFIHFLDEPAEPDKSESAGQSVTEENDDSFLILFDTDIDDGALDAELELKDDGHCTVTFPSDIRLSRLEQVKDTLSHSLDAKSVKLDVSKVKKMDTATFQLLWTYSAKVRDLDLPVEYQGASTEFIESSKLLGLQL